MAEKLNELPDLGFPVKWYREGRVTFLAPEFPTTEKGEPLAPTKWPVFYNPFSSLSRDLTVVLLRTFDRRVVVAEPLAGSGVRSIRLLLETETVSKALLNDINPNAVKVSRINAEHNGVVDRVVFSEGDAAVFLTKLSGKESRVAYVDVDPVGPPVKFVENSLRAVENNGCIGVSATDLASLVGNHPKTCFRKYGLFSAKNFFEKETALRLLASYVVLRAAALNIAATPLLSVYHRHFIRVFFKVTRGRSRVIKLLTKIGWIKACECLNIELLPVAVFPEQVCKKCGKKATVAGPAWLGPLHDKDIVQAMLTRVDDLLDARELLEKVAGEVEVVGFYPVDKLARVAKIPPPSPSKLVSALQAAGYASSLTHVDPTGVKTSAPVDELLKTVARLQP